MSRGYQRVTLVLGVGVLVVATLLTHRAWLPLIGQALIVSDPLTHADAVVPLAGDTERVLYSAALLHQGYAPRLALTSMPPTDIEWTYARQARDLALRKGVQPDQIIEVPGLNTSTYSEAQTIRQFAEQHGWRTLLVVTSPFHTRRARIILRDVFRDSGVDVRVRPVEDAWYKPERWWRRPMGRRMTILEYLKLLLFWIGYR